VSASVSFQEFFSARGFCSSAVLLWCCDFPVSLLYVEELLSCLFKNTYIFFSLGKYAAQVFTLKKDSKGLWLQVTRLHYSHNNQSPNQPSPSK